MWNAQYCSQERGDECNKALLVIIAKVSHMSRWLHTEVRSLTLEVHAPIPVLDVHISVAHYVNVEMLSCYAGGAMSAQLRSC